jgi:hypothetical protein
MSSREELSIFKDTIAYQEKIITIQNERIIVLEKIEKYQDAFLHACEEWLDSAQLEQISQYTNTLLKSSE